MLKVTFRTRTLAALGAVTGSTSLAGSSDKDLRFIDGFNLEPRQ